MDMLKMLNFTDFFGGLTEESKKLLSDIAIPKMLKKGETLFSEGDKGFALYLLGSGTIQLLKSDSESEEMVIKVIKPGEVFGEVILFEQDKYPVTAVSVQNCNLFILPKHQIHCLLNDFSFRNDFIRLLMSKQRYLTGKLINLKTHNTEHRLCFFLKEHYGAKDRINLFISKKAIAAAINTTPETLSRTLNRLKISGLLIWDGKAMEISKEFWEILER